MFVLLSYRNDLLLSGICVQWANTDHLHHHSKNSEKGDWYQECKSTFRDVPGPAWISSATQQPSARVYQICLPGILLARACKVLFVCITAMIFLLATQLARFVADVPLTSTFVPLGPFTGLQRGESDEQTEKRPPASRGHRRVFRWRPVPWSLQFLHPPRGHLPPLQFLPWPRPLQGPLCSTG